MFESFKRHPMFSIAQLIAALSALPAFFCTVSFFVALTPEEAIQRYAMALPSGWTAGVMNHGKYYRLWPISERPLFFAFSIGILGAALITLYSTLYVDWKDRKANKEIEATSQ